MTYLFLPTKCARTIAFGDGMDGKLATSLHISPISDCAHADYF